VASKSIKTSSSSFQDPNFLQIQTTSFTMQIHNTNKTELRSTVVLPDLFKGFVVNVPRKNKHYEMVKPISEKWLAE
jgi:hypothetical protein